MSISNNQYRICIISSLKVVNMPWLNRVDQKWFGKIAGDCKSIFVSDNHSPYGGLGDCFLNTIVTIVSSEKLRTKRFQKFAVEEYPACGTPKEALCYHKLDGESLAERILERA